MVTLQACEISQILFSISAYKDYKKKIFEVQLLKTSHVPYSATSFPSQRCAVISPYNPNLITESAQLWLLQNAVSTVAKLRDVFKKRAIKSTVIHTRDAVFNFKVAFCVHTPKRTATRQANYILGFVCASKRSNAHKKKSKWPAWLYSLKHSLS